MIPRIKKLIPLEDYTLRVSFDDNKEKKYQIRQRIAQVVLLNYDKIKS